MEKNSDSKINQNLLAVNDKLNYNHIKHGNGLFRNINVYKHKKGSRNMHIAFYPSKENALSSLSLKDLSDLDDENGTIILESGIIDIYLSIMLRKCGQKKKNILSEISSSIFAGNNYCANEVKRTIQKNELVIMPINKGGTHWTVSIIDVTSKSFMYIDSIKSGQNEEMDGLMFFNIFIENLIPKRGQHAWQFKQLPHFFQNDSHNCGIFMLQFCKNYLNNQPLTNVINCLAFRKLVKGFLIENSNNVLNYCLYCGEEKKNEVVEIKCGICNRWVDERCAVTMNHFQPNGSFTCELCSQFLR